MNKNNLKTIIEKVQNEKCLKHGQKATFKIYNGGVIIGNNCCTFFYNILTERLKEEMNRQLTSSNKQ